MPDVAQVNRSLSTIRSELEYLRDAGVLQQYQFDSILSQLPQKEGQPPMITNTYNYSDSKAPPLYESGQPQHYPQPQQSYNQQYNYQQPYQQSQPNYYNQQNAPAPAPSPQTIQQAQQDPAASPNHPKHNEWVKKVGSKFGNAAVWGAGATLGSDVMNSIWHKF